MKHTSHAVVWSAAATGTNGTSGSVNVEYCPFVTAMGNVSAATTITLQVSVDGSSYYDGPAQVLAGAGDFRIDLTTGARFVRLKSSASVTATAAIGAKD